MSAAFGKPRLGNPRDPVDDLIFLILSNRTQFDTAKAIFQSLKAMGEWEAVSRLTLRILEDKIRAAGLAKKRSKQMKAALQRLIKDFGSCRLEQLRRWNQQKAHDYLTSLPGVSDKVAKCVMMYTLGFKVLPVDIHVFRVSSRLGWTSRCRADQCHEDLEALVPPARRFAFHVDCIALGRTLCTSQRPNCPACPIRNLCFHYARRDEPKR